MNLLDDAWLPVRLRDGQHLKISPAELSRADVVAFDAPRADFNGALAQFGIALLQTVAAVETAAEWRQRFHSPPDRATLGDGLLSVRAHFEFDGTGARFMQDLDLRDGDPVPIANLLIETPGENTLKNNCDHFVKRHQVRRMCPHCAALALFTLQLNAPAGGAGHRTGLRGGGPLTTLLVVPAGIEPPRSLWHSLWLNVLPAPVFEQLNGERDRAEPYARMPWLASIHTVQAEGGALAPTQVHPLHVLWSMPRRIRLDMDNLDTGDCDLCQQASAHLISRYVTRNYGLNYKGAWRHPLSPYYAVKDDQLPVHPQPGGLGYRHWLALVLGVHNDKRQIEAAAVVSRFLGDPLLRRSGTDLQLRSFGFDMDNMKARCWYESTMPLYGLADCDAAARTQLRDVLSAWLAGADLAASYVRNAVKDAWFSADARGDFSHIDAAFWSRTEPVFYLLLRETVASLLAASFSDGMDAKNRWLRHLQSTALHLFEHDLVGAGPIERQNMARVARAHNQLLANLRGPKLRAALALPALLKTSPSPARKSAGLKNKPAGNAAA